MRTLQAIKVGSDLLKKQKIPSHILDAELLLSKTLNKSREEILINLDKTIHFEKLSIYKKYLIRRSRNEPMAYILGEKEFWSKKFGDVSTNTIIGVGEEAISEFEARGGKMTTLTGVEKTKFDKLMSEKVLPAMMDKFDSDALKAAETFVSK